jgi:hypothetical protein
VFTLNPASPQIEAPLAIPTTLMMVIGGLGGEVEGGCGS